MRAAAVLAALSAGRTLDELRRFLGGRARSELPIPVMSLLDEVDWPAGWRIVECADPAVTALIARDRNAQCTVLGYRYLAVPIEQEDAFRTRLRGPGSTLVNR